MKKRETFYKEVEVLSRYLRGKAFTYKGEPLTEEQSTAWRTCLLLQASLLYDLNPGHLHPADLRKDASQFIIAVSRLDVFVVAKYLKVSKNIFLRSLNETSPIRLHTEPEQTHCHEIWIRPLRGLWKKSISTRDPGMVWLVSTWLSFVARLDLSIELTDDALAEYKLDEDGLKARPSRMGETLREEKILTKWFGGWDYAGQFLPRHGPGAIADCKGRPSPYEKDGYLGTDDLLDDWSRYRTGYYPDYWYVRGCNPNIDDIRTSTLLFVPKSLLTPRVISKESATLAYWQQAVGRRMMDYFEDHPYLRQHIQLRKQERSQELARRGSDLFGSYATLDLSKASDSITLDLVCTIFRGSSILLDLLATRSTHTLLPDGERLELAKFAPMGSAVCFPTETIVFAAIVEGCLQEVGCSGASWYVYGDDLVVPDKVASVLLERLRYLGFCPNEDKSFVRHSDINNFREACGGEYLNNVDVSPIRLPRQFLHAGKCSEQQDELLLQAIDVCQRLNDAGLKYTALIASKTIPAKYREWVHPHSLGFQSEYNGPRRWNTALYRSEAKVLVPDPKFTGPIPNEEWRLEATLMSHLGRLEPQDEVPDQPYCVSGRKSVLKLRKKWAEEE